MPRLLLSLYRIHIRFKFFVKECGTESKIYDVKLLKLSIIKHRMDIIIIIIIISTTTITIIIIIIIIIII